MNLRNKPKNATTINAKSRRRVVNNAIVITDVDGRITDCNCAAAELLNRPVDQLSGEPLTAMLPGLPFALDTPGYNLAYAGFRAADEHWLAGMARLNDGTRICRRYCFQHRKNESPALHRADPASFLGAHAEPRATSNLTEEKPT